MDVISSILEAATNGTKKTRVMYKASLNFKQMQRYLPLLLKRELLTNVQTDSTHTIYKTTKKGLEFLKKYEELNNF
jgi:predicted transcriptional regulator